MIPAYTTHGPKDAPTLLLLHGFPFNQSQWKHQVEALSDTWHIITPDLRGQGKTPRGEGAVSIEFLVDDLIELLEEQGLEKIHLGGLSMGGYVALRMVDRHPELIDKLLLFDTRAEEDSNEGRVGRAGGIRTLRTKGMAALAEGLLPKLFPEGQRSGPAYDAIREMILESDPKGAQDALVAMASRLDLTKALERITQPTLIVVGSEDQLTPPDAAKAMHAAIPNATLAIIDGAGHVAPLTHPEPVNEAIREFLA